MTPSSEGELPLITFEGSLGTGRIHASGTSSNVPYERRAAPARASQGRQGLFVGASAPMVICTTFIFVGERY